MTQEYRSINDLLQLFRNGMLKPNFEYQRGRVWNLPQKKRLIDSVMRRYPLPLIYLHHIQTSISGMQRDDLEIIDGQQRINALYEFAEGAYPLFDPVKDDALARFPKFLQTKPCPWAEKSFLSLPGDLKKQFLDTQLPIAIITSVEQNEVRDLFVRLQSGQPLNAQEKRDAHPGAFTDFALKIGGKPQLARYPGHQFFHRYMRMKPAQDRGRTRQLAAQIAMLYLGRRSDGAEYFTDINAAAIDDFYYRNLDFEAQSEECYRLISILDKLDSLLGDGKRPKPRAHDAIHLVLLVDSLWDDYTRSWESKLSDAFDRFTSSLAEATRTKDSDQPNEFWLRYGQWTRVNSDRGERIRLRHEFYTNRMHEFLQPLQPKDSRRSFGTLEREILYWRDKKECSVCQATVDWAEAEAHHVKGHAKGGSTELSNAALVHRHCHPRGTSAEEFAA